LLTALAGNRNTNGNWNNWGNWGFWWSSGMSGANGQNLQVNSNGTMNFNANNVGNGFSVRCVQKYTFWVICCAFFFFDKG